MSLPWVSSKLGFSVYAQNLHRFIHKVLGNAHMCKNPLEHLSFEPTTFGSKVDVATYFPKGKYGSNLSKNNEVQAHFSNQA